MPPKNSNQKRPSKSELVVNRSAMRAAWAGVIVTLLIAGTSYIYNLWTSREVLDVSYNMLVEDQSLQIQDWSTTGFDGTEFQSGLVPIYWQITLVNNGQSNITIDDYELTQTPSSFFPTKLYGMMNQGLFVCDREFEPIHISTQPVKLEPGDTTTLCLKIGLLIHSKAYDLLKNKFGDEAINNVWDLMMYLWSNGLDLYGNEVFSRNDGVYEFSNPKTITEQTFKVVFVTSKGSKVEATMSPISWYVFSGYFNP